MEIHLVHKKTDYASVGASLDYNDGLAVTLYLGQCTGPDRVLLYKHSLLLSANQ